MKPAELELPLKPRAVHFQLMRQMAFKASRGNALVIRTKLIVKAKLVGKNMSAEEVATASLTVSLQASLLTLLRLLESRWRISWRRVTSRQRARAGG